MVPCPLCQSDVDWVTVKAAASVLGVSDIRVRQFIAEGRLPGAVKFTPGGGIQPLWKVPISSVIALDNARKEQQ